MLDASSFLVSIRVSGVAFPESEPDVASHTLAACLTMGGCLLCVGTYLGSSLSPTHATLSIGGVLRARCFSDHF